jgi:hypothetical protein
VTTGPIGGSIHLSPRPELGFRMGDLVSVHVIKRIEGAKWAVGIGGRVFPAVSELALEPGMHLQARVSAAGGKLALVIAEVTSDAVSAALQREGLPAGGDVELIARALARSGLPILTETIQKVKALLARTELEPRKAARLAATLVERGIDPSSPGAKALLPVLAFGERGGENPRRYKGRQMPDSPHAVKEYVEGLAAAPAPPPSSLAAYNHIRGRSQTWIVIPFLFTAGEDRIAGTLKILFDPFQARPLAFTMTTEGIGFHLPLQGANRMLRIFCDDHRVRRVVERGLDSLRSKFHNMGLEVDDTVNEGDLFDGFSPAGEGVPLPRVDTVG